MKFVCDECGETTDAATVRVEEGAILLTCGHCGVESPLSTDADLDTPEQAPTVGEDEDGQTREEAPADEDEGGDAVYESADGLSEAADVGAKSVGGDAEAESDDEADGLAPHKCPKCFHRQHRDDFCERCGLDLSADELAIERWDPISDGLEEEHEAALKLWAEVERSPKSDEAHEAFVEHCSESELLELAVRRYRSRLADYPDESPTASFATIATQRLEVLAMARISTDRWSDDLSRRVRTARRVLFIVAAVLLVLGLVLVVVMFRKQGTLLPGSN